MRESLINQDLVRWSGRRWFWTVTLLMALQIGAGIYLTRPLAPKAVFPSETSLGFASGTGSKVDAEWLELQDPMLFAAPNWKSVSALAWMRKPAVQLLPQQDFPPLEFLRFDAKRSGRNEPAVPAVSQAAHTRPEPRITLPVQPPPGPERESSLEIEGFGGRAPLARPALPTQFHNDYVSRTVVEAGIDPEGGVVSARLIVPSGSKQADADALVLARTMRFQAQNAAGAADPAEIAWGKLIFEWHALDLSPTNTVKR